MRLFAQPIMNLRLSAAITFFFIVFSTYSTHIERSPSKIYALYFPQFHRDPINDVIWGNGFTDWNNLRKAPKFNRFNQSILRPISAEQEPDLGYYDLLQQGTRRRQRELAVRYGIDGFIFHHYWFYQNESIDQPPVLSRPLLSMLQDGEPNISFAFNWALDNWVNAWQGKGHPYHSSSKTQGAVGKANDRKHNATFSSSSISVANRSRRRLLSVAHPHNNNNILYEQLCAAADEGAIREHYRYLRLFFHTENYIKIEGAPLFSVLRFVPHRCSNVISRLLALAIEDGFPPPGLHLIGGSTAMSTHDLYNSPSTSSSTNTHSFLSEYHGHLYYPYFTFPKRLAQMPSYCASNNIPANHTQPQYLSVMTHFDHTPRRNAHSAVIWDRNFAAPLTPPSSFLVDLVTVMMYEQCCQMHDIRAKGGQFIAINAWNEWAEGMVLEPSDRFSYAFLEAVERGRATISSIACDYDKYNTFINEMQQQTTPTTPT